MGIAQTAGRAGTHGQPWPRVVGAMALAVLGACGVIVLVVPPRASSSTSLELRSNWVLAGVLPASHDFPADWGYSLYAPLRRTPISDEVAPSTWRQGVPRMRYGPAACINIPKILDHLGAGVGPGVGIDHYTTLQAAEPGLMDDDATGQRSESGPNASLHIWVVPDGLARISNYVDWLGRCGSYQVTNYSQDGAVKNKRIVTTVVEERAVNGAEAAVTVTRTFTTPGSRQPPLTYHVSYHALRGVILECSIYDMDGADRDLVQRRAAETLQRLRT
jgi:hypothetical protein